MISIILYGATDAADLGGGDSQRKRSDLVLDTIDRMGAVAVEALFRKLVFTCLLKFPKNSRVTAPHISCLHLNLACEKLTLRGRGCCYGHLERQPL